MWVGARDRPEFQDAYLFCEQHAAQLALRRDLDDALARPAASVERIVLLRQTREEQDRPREEQLVERYPEASIVQLLGPLCAGESPGSLEPFGSKRFYWHQANQVLPGWFRTGRVADRAVNSVRRSVAVIASTESAAQPLLDLAASAGASAVWCRRGDRFRIRNVELFWWDDSAAPPASGEVWRERIAAVAGPVTAVVGGANATTYCVQRHAWLAGGPTAAQCREAREAGVDAVITKPAQIEPLLDMIGDADHSFGGAAAGVESEVQRRASAATRAA